MAGIEQFKKLVSALESSDNPEVRHPAATKGVSKGDTAIGQHGLMPNTVKELANRARLSNEQYPSDETILNADNSQIGEMLQNNPELMKLYVDRLSKHVMEKSNDNPENAYMRWLYGHNLPDERIQQVKKKDPETLQRIRDVIEQKHMMSQQPDAIQIPEEPYEDKPYTPLRKK